MKISLSIRDALAEQMRSVAIAAGTSTSSVAEVALKRLFALGGDKEIVMTVIQEGGSARRFTRKTWLDAFYAALRDLVPERLRTGGSGYEFMRYDVMASAERSENPEQILIHIMETGLPTTGASTYHGTRFSATIDSSPVELAKTAFSWLKMQR